MMLTKISMIFLNCNSHFLFESPLGTFFFNTLKLEATAVCFFFFFFLETTRCKPLCVHSRGCQIGPEICPQSGNPGSFMKTPARASPPAPPPATDPILKLCVLVEAGLPDWARYPAPNLVKIIDLK